jgi:hypothetical protein
MTAGKFAALRTMSRPLQLCRIERTHEFHQGDLAFVFVAVIAGHQQHRRPAAAGRDGDRDGNPAISRFVRGVRQLQEAVPEARPLEVDRGRDACHALASA